MYRNTNVIKLFENWLLTLILTCNVNMNSGGNVHFISVTKLFCCLIYYTNIISHYPISHCSWRRAICHWKYNLSTDVILWEREGHNLKNRVDYSLVVWKFNISFRLEWLQNLCLKCLMFSYVTNIILTVYDNNYETFVKLVWQMRMKWTSLISRLCFQLYIQNIILYHLLEISNSFIMHYSEVILSVMSFRMFAQQFAQAQIKWNIIAPQHWPLYGDCDRWIPFIQGQ